MFIQSGVSEGDGAQFYKKKIFALHVGKVHQRLELGIKWLELVRRNYKSLTSSLLLMIYLQLKTLREVDTFSHDSDDEGEENSGS